MTDILKGLGSWWNGNGALDNDVGAEVDRAKAAQLDYIVIKYGNPAVEQAFSAAGIMWGTERFVDRTNIAGEARMLGDAVDAGAQFVVINAESGGGWDASPGAGIDMVALMATIRNRHANIPLYGCVDTRGPRTSYPYEANLLNHADGMMPMIYPLEFYPSRPAGYVHSAVGDAMAPMLTAAGPPIHVHPVLQVYDGIGADAVLEQVRQASVYTNTSLSFYTIGHATDDEWQQLVNLRRLMNAPAPASAQQQVVEAFIRVAAAVRDGLPVSSIAPHDRDIVRFIAAVLTPGS